MPDNRANRDKKKKSSQSNQSSQLKHVSANEMFVLAGGKKDNRGISHPSEEDIASAANFIKENKK